MYIERELEKELEKYLRTKEIIAVLGPRQSGKSTLLNHLVEKLPKMHTLTFDDRQVLTLFEHDPEAFVGQHITPYEHVFIDEVQYAKESGKILKYIYDTCNCKLFISGSSASELSLQSLRFLVGRIFIFHLYPLSFREFLQFKERNLLALLEKGHFTLPVLEQTDKFLEEFVLYGGYPRVVLAATKEEKQTVLRGIYNTYFLREIKEILQLSGDYKLSLLLKALALQIGGIISYAELGSLSGFAYKDLRSYLNILEKTFICVLLKNFHTNKRTELVKSPKVFFLDTGLRNEVIQNFSRERTDKGELYENLVCSELIKQGFEPKYWRTKAKAEVDFVIEHENKPIPLEVKSFEKNLTRSFSSFLEAYTPKQGFLLSLRASGKKKVDKTTIRLLPLAGSFLIKSAFSTSGGKSRVKGADRDLPELAGT